MGLLCHYQPNINAVTDVHYSSVNMQNYHGIGILGGTRDSQHQKGRGEGREGEHYLLLKTTVLVYWKEKQGGAIT